MRKIKPSVQKARIGVIGPIRLFEGNLGRGKSEEIRISGSSSRNFVAQKTTTARDPSVYCL